MRATVEITKETEGAARYIRGNGKWVKITRLARGRYSVACGYEGQTKSLPNIKQTPTLRLAMSYSAGWIMS